VHVLVAGATPAPPQRRRRYRRRVESHRGRRRLLR
jgi:hypothetical protein